MAAVFKDGHRGVLPEQANKVLSGVTYPHNSDEWRWLYRYMKSLRIIEFESPFTSKYGFSVKLELVTANL